MSRNARQASGHGHRAGGWPVRSGIRGYQNRTPLLSLWAARPGLLVTLTIPEHLNAGHLRFARDLAASTGMRPRWNGPGAGLPPAALGVCVMCPIPSGPGRCSPTGQGK